MATKAEITGVVVSDKMDKSVVVAVERQVRDPLYGKTQRRTSKFLAHNEQDGVKIGDRPRIAVLFELLGELKLMETSGARYKRGSEAITAPDGNTLRFEEILDWLDRSQERMTEVLGRNDDTTLAREIAVGNNRTMTVGQRLFFLYFHETYHVGQTELFRQLAGKHDKLI